MYTLVEDFGRPDQELITALGKMPTGVLSEALGRPSLAHKTMQPVYRPARLAGPAFPVRVATGDNLMVHLALNTAQPGDVLVIDTSGSTDVAYFTELMARAAAAKGIKGLVTDGAVRDWRALGELKYPVWAAASSPVAAQARAGGSVGLPVALAGCVVAPGDLVVADDDGVVVIPQDEARSVQAAAAAIQEREAALRVRLAAGENLFDLLGLQAALDCMICRRPQTKKTDVAASRTDVFTPRHATPEPEKTSTRVLRVV